MTKFPLVILFAAYGLNICAQDSNSHQSFAIPEFQLAHLPEIEEELSADFFARNRQRLRELMPDSSMVVLFSAPQKSKSNDIDYRYHQDPDFFYFTGIKDPNTLLIIFKNATQIGNYQTDELLFIEEKNDQKEKWTGKMIGIEEASETSGIFSILPNVDFKTLDFDWSKLHQVYCNKYEHIERDDKEHPGDLKSLTYHFDAKMKRAGQDVLVNEAEEMFAQLRQVKTAEELNMLRRAAEITCQAQLNAIQFIKPGLTEYQIEAVISYTFRANGGDGEAFPSIVAAGENGAIMHYTANNSLLIPGHMVIMDIGAQYQNYSADVTRTVPINGKFTKEQAAVYQLVLDAQTVAIRYATAGNKFWIPHEEAYRTIGKGLIRLGIITEWGDISKYFIHGTSHYLGLDVHDAGVYRALAPGDVITVEPGIYIPPGSPCDKKWWGIYVRIEDDLLITRGAPEILSDCVPKTIAELEALMAQ